MLDDKMKEAEEAFYLEVDAEKRKKILFDDIDDSCGEDVDFMKKLWVMRYGKNKPRYDNFVKALMDLKFLYESGSVDLGGKKKKQAVEIIHSLCLFDIDKKSDMQKEIIQKEIKNAFLKYIDVSAKGRGFTSVLFGMGQLSDDSVAKKLAEQISVIAFDTPHMLKMDKEFEILQRSALGAFREVYPNREHFLRKI